MIRIIIALLAIAPINFLKPHAFQLSKLIAYPTVNSLMSMDVLNVYQDLDLALMAHALYLLFLDALLLLITETAYNAKVLSINW
jgi:hypothetical protein